MTAEAWSTSFTVRKRDSSRGVPTYRFQGNVSGSGFGSYRPSFEVLMLDPPNVT